MGSSEYEQDEGLQEFSAQFDEKVAVLASDRCRTILRILIDMDADSIEFSDLATAIVSQEGGEHIIDRDTVIIDLHHRQLPKLADAGVVEYDHSTGIVRYHGDDGIESLVRKLDDG